MSLLRRQLLSASRFRTSAVILPKARPSWQALQTRSYASSHDEEPKDDDYIDYKGDIPWAVAAIGITIPSVWYIYTTEMERQAKRDAAGGIKVKYGKRRYKEGKLVTDEDEEEEEEEESESSDEEEEKGESDGGEEKSDEGEEKDDSADKDEQSDEEKKDAIRQGKGNDSKGADTTKGNKPTQDDPEIDDSDDKNRTVKYESAKGGLTVRKESKQAKNLGHSDDDTPSTAKSSGPSSNKQAKDGENVYNTDTKHSIAIDKSDEMSKKPSGTPETAKLKGPNDPWADAKKD